MDEEADRERLAVPALSEHEISAREIDLRTALSGVAELVAGALSLGLLLERVARSAVGAIPRAHAAGVSLLSRDSVREGPEVQVSALGPSDSLVARIDDIQYELLDEGPCLDAMRTTQTVTSGSLGGDSRWPRFGPRVGRLGVHSALSLPLTLPDGTVVGALNVYSRDKDAFDADAARIGELFAGPAGVAVHNAQMLDLAQQHAQQLQEALRSRATIDQAIGIVRSRSGGTADEGFARLRAISQSENVKLVVVAERIVAEAVRRARSR